MIFSGGYAAFLLNLISRDSPELTLYTDSSLISEGAHLNDQTCGDNWTASEKENHINYLELLAIYFGDDKMA